MRGKIVHFNTVHLSLFLMSGVLLVWTLPKLASLVPVLPFLFIALFVLWSTFLFGVLSGVCVNLAFLVVSWNDSTHTYENIGLFVLFSFIAVVLGSWFHKRKWDKAKNTIGTEESSLLTAVCGNVSEGIALVDIETKRLTVLNNAFCLLGSRTANDEKAMTLYDCMDEKKETIDNLLNEVQRTRTPKLWKGYYHTANDERIEVEQTISFGVHNKKEYLVLVVRKISEEKHENEALMQERTLLRALLDTIPDVVYAKDRESRFIVVNKAQVELLGAQSEEDVLGKTDHDFYPREFADAYLQDEQTLLQTGIPLMHKEESAVAPNGEIRWLSTNKIPLRDTNGTIIGLVGSGRDVTHLKKLELSLRQSEAYLRMVLDFLPVSVMSLDLSGKIQFLNKKFFETFGFLHNEITTIEEWFYTAVADKQKKEELHHQWVSNVSLSQLMGKDPSVLEYDVECRNGTRRHIHMMTKTIADGIIIVLNDLTEQQKIEEALERERTLLRTIIDVLPDRIFVKDTEARFLLNNEAHIRGLGATTQEEVTGKTDFDFKPRHLAALSYADDLHVLKTGQVLYSREERTRFPSGEWGWILVTKVPLLDSKGNITGLVGISRDITELKTIQESLTRERNLFRTLIDSLPDRIYVKDRESKFLLNNKAHMAALGVTHQEELYGKTDFDFRRRDMAALSISDDQRVMETGEAIFNKEEETQFPDGSTGWVLTTKVPLRDENGTIVGLIGISRDITRQKAAEEALIRERNLLRTLIDNIPDRIFVKDTEARFLLNNKAHIVALGATLQEEVRGKTDFDFRPKELAEEYYKSDMEVLRKGVAIMNQEQPSYSADGTQGWQLSTKIPLRDPDNNIIGLVGISRDITQLKKVEQEREALIDELQEALASVKTLKGLLPICANCKKIRNDKGYWEVVESYVMKHSDATFTHGLCPDCQKLLYPDFTKKDE